LALSRALARVRLNLPAEAGPRPATVAAALWCGGLAGSN
jgi:hypothetical protein